MEQKGKKGGKNPDWRNNVKIYLCFWNDWLTPTKLAKTKLGQSCCKPSLVEYFLLKTPVSWNLLPQWHRMTLQRNYSKYHWTPVNGGFSDVMNSSTCYWCNSESAELFHALWDYHWSILVRLEMVLSRNDFYGICLISWIVCTGHCSWEIIFNG